MYPDMSGMQSPTSTGCLANTLCPALSACLEDGDEWMYKLKPSLWAGSDYRYSLASITSPAASFIHVVFSDG
ncbi:hypothetical protein D9758_015339 [Tetrapyrgos nigripes]|uniref:Uncharacterized protein n=1 Tax=Tetrapyrgos nigripes TaxID=182062 RepID=A0A8H5CL24_9AGAR|nr:hypothetical protein D9758_015339 [Tetrapyrgos nigripes]